MTLALAVGTVPRSCCTHQLTRACAASRRGLEQLWGARGAATSSAAVLSAVAAWRSVGRRRAHRHLPHRTARAAVVEGDVHAEAVRRWLEDFVVDRNFCPWAKPAKARNGIRVVTSAATEPEGVLEDLASEAELLPINAEAEDGEATTTLLVCPHVEEWGEYEPFRDFFSAELDDGTGFVDEFNMKIVAFHPTYARFGLSVEAGDRVAVAGPDGTTTLGTVLDEEAGVHPDDGEELVEVCFDDGEEFLVRYSEISSKMVLGEDGSEHPGNDGSADAANVVCRAPRPTLHLLRMEDLERAGLMERSGTGPMIEAVLQNNAARAAELGSEGMDDLLARCG